MHRCLLPSINGVRAYRFVSVLKSSSLTDSSRNRFSGRFCRWGQSSSLGSVLAFKHSRAEPLHFCSSPTPAPLPPSMMRMGHGGSESGESEDRLEQLPHPLITHSISLLPQDQDFGVPRVSVLDRRCWERFWQGAAAISDRR